VALKKITVGWESRAGKKSWWKAFSRPIRRGTPLGASQNRQKVQYFPLTLLAKSGNLRLQ